MGRPRKLSDSERIESHLTSQRKWEAKNRDKRNHASTLNKYGLTEETFSVIVQKQEGRCAICERIQRDGKKKQLDVDHCHATKKVRGLLCAKCNRAIGLLEDNPTFMRRGAEYLEKANG